MNNMTEVKGSRVVIIDERTQISTVKTESQIVRENEEIKVLLENGRPKMTDQADVLKEAVRADDFAKFMERKKAEKASAVAAVETAEQQEKIIAEEQRVSLKFGVVGVGQAGSKLTKVFYDLGYDVCAINTAKQDLELLDIPDEQKFYMNYSIGGAGRDLDVGKAAIEEDFESVKEFVDEHIGSSDVSVLCVSGGGGTGAGAASTMVSLLNSFGRPVIVLYVLPGSSDDSQSKHNAIKTLAELADLASKEVINSLVLVDNAKIEVAYPDLSQAAFWKTANNAIVEPLHMFNAVTARPTDYEALDSMDFAKSLLEAGNCVLFGSNKVLREKYEGDETALVEAIVDNLEHGLLASGFDLKEAQTVGVLITARQEVLEKVPYNAISYIFKYIAESYDSARTYKGVYALPADDDSITMHFIFSGMGLPKDRIESLKNEAKKHMDNLQNKKKLSSDKMAIDLGKDKTTSAADDIMDRIKKKKGAMGKLITASKKSTFERKR